MHPLICVAHPDRRYSGHSISRIYLFPVSHHPRESICAVSTVLRQGQILPLSFRPILSLPLPISGNRPRVGGEPLGW